MEYKIPSGHVLFKLMKDFSHQYSYIKLVIDEDFVFNEDELYDLNTLSYVSDNLKKDIDHKIKFCVFKNHPDTYQQGLYISLEELSNFII